jgi:hypothetical protein
MAEPKTKATKASVAAFLAAIADEQRRKDCKAVARLMQEATGEKPVLWGTNIVGFGAYRYEYASGGTGDWPLVAFAPRRNELTLYVMAGFEGHAELLAKLGRHKTGKSCLYLRHLADVDMAVLKELIGGSVAALEGKRVR